MLNWKVIGRVIRAESESWEDDGAPLLYQLCYIADVGWRAEFEGTVFATGTLQECLQACETSDLDA